MNLKLQSKSRTIYAFLMALFSVWGWAQSVTIIPDKTTTGNNSNTYVAALTNFTAANIDWAIKQWNPTNLQVRGNQTDAFVFYNTSAMPGNITKVTLNTFSGTFNNGSIRLAEGTTTQAAATTGVIGVASSGKIEWTPTAGNTFFKIIFLNGSTSGTARITDITVEYASPTQTTSPTITASGTATGSGTDNYWGNANITLESASSGALLYYTTDGTTPTISSTQYSAPFQISVTSEIKAIAVAAPLTVSTVTTKQITITNPATATIPYNQTFNNTLGDWVNYKESGSAGYTGWTTAASGAESNGYNLGAAKAWLISPKFTGVQTNSLLSFNYASQYEGDDLKVVYSTNYAGYGDPTTATWTNLTTIAEASGTAVSTGSLTNFVVPASGNVHFAFVYEDASAGGWAMWRVSNLSINTPVVTSTTTWNGSSWSNGTPAASVDAIITGAYTTSTATPAFVAKNITVKNGGILEITSGNTIGAVNVTIEDGGNLIQKDGSTLSYTGAFKVLKNGTSEINKYAFWSSPVVGQTLANIYTVTPTSITEYETATDSYVNAGSTSAFAKGYSIETPVANAALVFTGAPNNGTQTFTLATSGNGFNLIGNPYPSSLGLGAFYTANSARISSTFYFWDNKSTNVTLQNGASTTNFGYATFNAANGANPTWVPAPNGLGGTAVIPTGDVANIGQGFIVKTLNTFVDTSLTFNNDMRGAASGTFFNKNNSSTEGKFWLKLNSEYNTNNIFAVDYTNGASDSFDNYDSKAIGMGSDGFYTLADAQKLIIQGKESFDIDDVVPVGAKHFQNGNFTIALVKKEGLFNNGQAIYLHDKVTGTYTDLQNGAYTFTANAGESTSRFEIVYKLNVLATAEVQKDGFEVYRNGQDFVVRNNKNIEQVEIFDAAGRKIQTINENSKLIRVQLVSKGVYILKALSEGKEYTKKIIK
ncbi:FN3 associated domain-containing protein [Chryseobacterium mulctrae]|uniref:FN3 associated domain-containing protein n=1 Tax=Chryseobacterium mulctrae TaxID=2576777 RepID=UPI001116E78B|nr:FN3 associated domain-containing protein [Chryseobacterium mulctrae]